MSQYGFEVFNSGGARKVSITDSLTKVVDSFSVGSSSSGSKVYPDFHYQTFDAFAYILNASGIKAPHSVSLSKSGATLTLSWSARPEPDLRSDSVIVVVTNG
jgi:hypothetical protein